MQNKRFRDYAAECRH